MGTDIGDRKLDQAHELGFRMPEGPSKARELFIKTKLYSTEYSIKKGDNLSTIAKRHDFTNPGPIFHFPHNKDIIKNQDLIHPGDVLYIPHTRKKLKEEIEMLQDIARLNRLGSFKGDMDKIRRKIQENSEHKIFDLLALLSSYRSSKILKMNNKDVIKKVLNIKFTQTQYIYGMIDSEVDIFKNKDEMSSYLEIVLKNIQLDLLINPTSLVFSIFGIALDVYEKHALSLLRKLEQHTVANSKFLRGQSLKSIEYRINQISQTFYSKII